MDLDGDADDDLDQIWHEVEPEIQSPKSSFPPSRTLGFLFLLTAGLGGLQGIFALIFSNGSAHLKDLGLSKPAQAIVWMAGPVAGMTIQPYCGICSDHCLASWGRRRPFIAWGAVAAVASLLGLASTKRLAAFLVCLCVDSCSSADAHFQEEPVKVAAANITVFFIVALNIAIQPLQGGLRALIADMCPRTQQPIANAVAGTVVNGSNILYYALSFVDLRRIAVLRALGGDSQFSILCIITSGTIAVSVGLTCLGVEERSAVAGDDGACTSFATARGTRHSVRAQLWYLCTSFPRLPRQVQQVFKVQFFSWMDKTHVTAAQRLDKDFQARAARMGSLGLMLFALVALITGTILSITAHKPAGRGRHTRLTQSIRLMWVASQALFALCMLATAFTSSLSGVYILVGLCGISWAVTVWAPFALISAQIVQDTGRSGATIHSEPLMQHEGESAMEDDRQHDVEVGDKEGDDQHDRRDGADDACERRPGIVLGLHNVAIAGPQIVAAAGCSLIFWMLEGSSEESVGWALRAGGLAALGAAIMAGGIHDEVREFPLKMVRLAVGTRD
ncbi:hypothetical protein SLS62_010914 [Diatrype stigma]|uniref:Uncharacterized protein n=1 Tax=Diatrype stigma TaxID=117547 RepID=A0AAN9U7S4_9PEZI